MQFTPFSSGCQAENIQFFVGGERTLQFGARWGKLLKTGREEKTMRYTAFGPEGGKTLVLLHGGGLSWWNYRTAAQALAAEYRVVLPILNGHSGSDRPFTTVEDNAREILSFIDRRLGGRIALLGGLSLGGQVAVEMLHQRSDLCDAALVESAALVPDRLTRALAGPAFSSSYGLIRKPWFARLQFQSLHMDPSLFEDYFRDTCAIEKRDMIAFLRASAAYTLPDLSAVTARAAVYVGERENGRMQRSARLLMEALPGASLHVLPGLYHGEFSLNRGADYARAVRALLEN